MNTLKQKIMLIAASAMIFSTSFSSAIAQDVPPGVQDVVKLVKAGLGEDVILAHIRNRGLSYSLNADQLIYLHDQGVTQNEIKALLTTGSAPTVPPPGTQPPSTPVAPPPAPLPAPTGTAPVVPSAPVVDSAPTVPPAQPVTIDAFQAQLAPYGTWVSTPDFGLCWRPSVTLTDPYWRPYCDSGHWVYTAEGWFWQSDYPWGDMVFHYGRWYRDSVGWVWMPGYDWAPSWVCWRHTDGYCGWAPLPPAAVFTVGVGLSFHGRVGVDLDFGLGPAMFTFVGYDHFWDHHLHGYLVPHDRVEIIFGRTVIMNGYRYDHGRFFVEGPGRERIGLYTHHEIHVESPAYRRVPGRDEGHRVIREERRER